MKTKRKKVQKDSAKRLAAGLWRGLNADNWGWIDPWSFKYIAQEKPSEWGPEEKSLYKILKNAWANSFTLASKRKNDPKKK